MTIYKQEKPVWCTHSDCIFKRRVCDNVCGGILPNPELHDGDFNYYRICIRTNGDIFDLQVNDSDLAWLRWVFDALDGKKTSWLSQTERKL